MPATHRQTTLGQRGRAGDSPYRARRPLHTGADVLTAKQNTRLDTNFVTEEHVEVETTYGIYERIVAAHGNPTKRRKSYMEGRNQLGHKQRSRRPDLDSSARPNSEAACC